MNPSEANNAITLGVAVFGPILARWGVDSSTIGSLAAGAVTAAPAIGAALWGIYSHWNMVKVPETATIVPKK